MSTFDYLPSIIMTSDTRILFHGVGTIYLLSSLSIDNALYVLGSLFNLLSINHLITCYKNKEIYVTYQWWLAWNYY